MASNPASSQSLGAAESTLSTTIRRSPGAPLRVQTYKNLLYLALAFPLGLVYFVGLIFGVALGFGLLITWIGLPVLLVTLFAATVVAGFEAALARYLGGVNASVPTFLAEFDVSGGLVLPGDGFVDAVKRLVTARTTWTSVVLVLAKFGFGLLSFVALTVSGAVTGAFLAAPFIYDDPDVLLGVGGVVVDTFPDTRGFRRRCRVPVRRAHPPEQPRPIPRPVHCQVPPGRRRGDVSYHV